MMNVTLKLIELHGLNEGKRTERYNNNSWKAAGFAHRLCSLDSSDIAHHPLNFLSSLSELWIIMSASISKPPFLTAEKDVYLMACSTFRGLNEQSRVKRGAL